MENLDIEKLSRETPYKLPENTFESVQNNVLQKTLRKTQTPVFNLKWIYAAAAVLLLIFTANFLINTNGKKVTTKKTQLTTQNQIVSQQNIAAQAFTSSDDAVAQNTPDMGDTNDSDVVNLTSQKGSHLNGIKQSKGNADLATVNKMKTNSPTEAQIDNVLDGFSSSEIASLSNNSEQDVYLDLYN